MRFISLVASFLRRSTKRASIVISSRESSTKRKTFSRGFIVDALITSVHTTIVDVCSRMRDLTLSHVITFSRSAGQSRLDLVSKRMDRPRARPTAPRRPPQLAMSISFHVQPYEAG